MKSLETILVVDDEELLRWSLRAFLEELEFQVVEAAQGREAVEACLRYCPQLILLDISMPEMDGFEVCRCLKADPATAEPPVIFISVLMSNEDKVKAFACGGVDYVTKPFHFEEVRARIQAHLNIHRQRKQLKEQHEALQRLERLRDSLTHMIVHDMRTPLTGTIGYLELAIDELPPEASSISPILENALTGTSRLSEMITQMLIMSRHEFGSMPLNPCVCDVTALAVKVVRAFQGQKIKRRVLVSCQQPVWAKCDPVIVERILENLLGNALKSTVDDGLIEVRLAVSEDWVRIAVADDGLGIPPEFHERIFEKFSQLEGEPSGDGFGLGLAFCKLAVEAHFGKIGVESEPGKGSTFWFALPSTFPVGITCQLVGHDASA